jgi:hypothetical protein
VLSLTGEQLRQLGDVGGDPPGVVAREQVRRRTPPNEAAKAEIIAAQEAKAKARAKASRERSRLKAKGELRRMPLTGKAALDAIRG